MLMAADEGKDIDGFEFVRISDMARRTAELAKKVPCCDCSDFYFISMIKIDLD
jgi:hypothetical protein